jgi:outer membrane lipase/esterase
MARTALAIADLTVFGDSLSDSGNLFRLIGLPQPPAWNGRSSNGPTYAEQLANFLGVNLDDRAFGAAEASTSSPPVLTDPDTGNRLPIDLPAQVASYTAQLNGNEPSAGTAALIFIGSNDYVAFLGSNPPTDPASVQAFVASVVNSVAQAIAALTQAGVGKIILFALPDLGITPDA